MCDWNQHHLVILWSTSPERTDFLHVRCPSNATWVCAEKLWEDIKGKEECRGSFFLKYMEWNMEATIGQCGSQLTGWSLAARNKWDHVWQGIFVTFTFQGRENGREIGETGLSSYSRFCQRRGSSSQRMQNVLWLRRYRLKVRQYLDSQSEKLRRDPQE